MRHAASLAPLLLLALLAPAAHAQPAARTLSDFEEPVLGEDLLLDFRVTAEEAGKPGIVVFLNPPSRAFGLTVYRADGTEAYVKNGSRGVQPFPALEEGDHRVYVRGNGAFQITHANLDRLGGGERVTQANGTLRGADAWVLAATRDWVLHLEGDVQAELRDLGGPTRNMTVPMAHNVSRGMVYVLTLRGPDETPYRLWLEPVGPEPDPSLVNQGPTRTPTQDAPGAPLAALVLGAVAAALVLRRRH